MPNVQLADCRICYRVRGEGRPALVLIHGAAGGAHVWAGQLGPLSRQRKVVALDLPGHGCAGAAPEVSIEAYARVTLELMDHLGLKEAALLGHSMGGAVAQQAALFAPHRVSALILASTGAKLPVSDMVFQAIDNAFDSFGGLLGTFAFSPKADRELVRAWTEPPLLSDQKTVKADFMACKRFDVTEQIGTLEIPTLVLWGEDDQMVSGRRAESLARRIPNARFEKIPGAGHMLFQEAPDLVNPIVDEFLRGLEPARGPGHG